MKKAASHVDPAYATRAEASAYLNLSLDQLKGLARDGLLTLEYLNARTIRIPWAEIRTVMQRKRELEHQRAASRFTAAAGTTQAILEQARRHFGSRIPGLRRAL